MRQTSRRYERGLTTRKPKNEAEALFYEKAGAAGWTVTKSGWPDFFCVNDRGDVCCVEVKPRTSQRLKNDQHRIMQALSRAGIRCYKWTPDAGFQSIED